MFNSALMPVDMQGHMIRRAKLLLIPVYENHRGIAETRDQEYQPL